MAADVMSRTDQSRSEDGRMMMKLPAIFLFSMCLTLEVLSVPTGSKTQENDKEQTFKHIAELFCQMKSIDGLAKVKNDSNLFKVEDNVLCGKDNKGGLCSALCKGDDDVHANVECIARIVTLKGTKSDELFRKFCDAFVTNPRGDGQQTCPDHNRIFCHNRAKGQNVSKSVSRVPVAPVNNNRAYKDVLLHFTARQPEHTTTVTTTQEPPT